jgi:flavin-binding protein dodecin
MDDIIDNVIKRKEETVRNVNDFEITCLEDLAKLF